MRAVIVHPSLNRGGGAEKVCLAAIRALINGGYRVKLVTVERTDWHFLEERFGEISRPSEETYVMKRMPIQGKSSQAVFTLSFFLPELVYHRIKGNVVLNTYGDLVDSVADVSYINALPVRVLHKFPECGFSYGVVWRAIAQAYGFCLRAVDRLFGSNILLTNSSFTQGVVKRHLGRDSLVVFPPVDLEKFRCTVNDVKRENLVVSVCRLRLEKNLSLIPRVAEVVKDVSFVVFGLADQASQDAIVLLKKKIRGLGVEDRVRLFVNQPFGQLVDVLASAKVFLHTQNLEAFGMAVVESMAAGCVPVVPRNGGPFSDILDSKQGFFGFSYETVEEAAHYVRTLLGDEGLRQRVSVRALERAEVFDCSVFEKKIVDVVDRVYRAKFG
jgi:glycosyltransferase involved in cell wall biosynthesis